MTPTEAAKVKNVSRWSIMQAINRQQLKATRDNRNHWQINEEDLQQCSAFTVATLSPTVAEPNKNDSNDSNKLREKLAGETARANAAERARDQAEADRDRWQRMAEKLAEKPRFKWPWQE